MTTTLPIRRDPHSLEYGGYSTAAESDLPLAGFKAVLRRRYKTVALCLVTCVLLGGAYTVLATPVYEATSLVRFEQEHVNLPQLVQQLSTENRISTEIEVLQGRSAAESVIDSLGLRAQLVSPRRARVTELFSVLRVAPPTDTLSIMVHSEPDGRFTLYRPQRAEGAVSARVGETVAIDGVTLALAPAALEAPELRLRVVSLDEAVRDFEDALKVSRPARDADLIAVRVRASDPTQAATAANVLAEHLIKGRQEVQRASTDNTVRYLNLQLDTLGRQLRAAEDSLRAYRERAQAMDPAEDARIQVGRLAQLEAERARVQAEGEALDQLLLQIRRDSTRVAAGGPPASRRLIAFPTLFRNQAAAEILRALAQAENERSALLVRRTPQDPDVQMLNARVEDLDAQLQGIAQTYLQGLKNQVAALQEAGNRFGGELDRLPEKEVRTARLQREVKVLQDMYTLIQTRLKEAQITDAMDDPTMRIVDPASAPDRPLRPRPLINLALSLVMGSLLGMTVALTRDRADRSIRSRADALFAAGLPVLGAIPRVQSGLKALRRGRSRWRSRRPAAVRGGRTSSIGKPSDPGRQEHTGIGAMLVTHPDVPLGYAESFNQLEANLALAHREQPLKVLVFTSPLPGEGKTVSAVNFAVTMALRGIRVLLIDADLRCGMVNEVFGCARQPGFAELLAGRARFENGAKRISIGESGGLVVLPSGALLRTPGPVLAVERVRQVLDMLTPLFDLVVLDTPPVNLLADAALLGAAADGVILVVRAGRTQVDALRFAMEQLTAARAPVIGTLLNDIDLRRNASDDGAYRYLAETERYHASRR